MEIREMLQERGLQKLSKAKIESIKNDYLKKEKERKLNRDKDPIKIWNDNHDLNEVSLRCRYDMIERTRENKANGLPIGTRWIRGKKYPMIDEDLKDFRNKLMGKEMTDMLKWNKKIGRIITKKKILNQLEDINHTEVSSVIFRQLKSKVAKGTLPTVPEEQKNEEQKEKINHFKSPKKKPTENIFEKGVVINVKDYSISNKTQNALPKINEPYDKNKELAKSHKALNNNLSISSSKNKNKKNNKENENVSFAELLKPKVSNIDFNIKKFSSILNIYSSS